jgi:hypothetical protein
MILGLGSGAAGGAEAVQRYATYHNAPFRESREAIYNREQADRGWTKWYAW